MGELSGVTIGSVLFLLLGIIGYFIKQNIESKDERIKDQDRRIKELDDEFGRLGLIVQDCKGQVSMLNNDVTENRRQLIKTLGTIEEFISVNEKIEKQLDRSNVLMERGNALHAELKDVIAKVIDIKSR